MSLRKKRVESLAVVAACLASFLALAERAHSIEVSFIVGDVNITRAGKSKALTMTEALKPGDLVGTGKNSLCTLKYKDGSNVEVRSDSKIMVGNESVPGSDFVSLISGVVNGKFKKMQKGGSKVYTPTTVCSIRGTEFTIAASDSGESRVQLEEGKLQIRNPYGKVNINENENADIGIAARPRQDRKARPLDKWMDERDKDFADNPGAAGDKYGSYMDTLGQNTSKASGRISSLDRDLTRNKMRGKDGLEKANADLENLDESLQDEMSLNNAAKQSLEGIIGGIGEGKADLFEKFNRVKQDCNKVADQQRRNYEALQAVREAYRKAYDEIVKSHKNALDSIKQGLQ